MKDVIDRMSRLMLADVLAGIGARSTKAESPSLMVETIVSQIEAAQAEPCVWYRFCNFLPDEIKDKPLYGVSVRFGDDDVFMVRPDRFEQFKRLVGFVRLEEYPQERMDEQVRQDILRGIQNTNVTIWQGNEQTTWR